MRWPLRNQILVRMMVLLLVTISAVTYANISSLLNHNDSREKDRVEKIAQLLKDTRFPLTETVLENMKSLSGAEFAVVSESNEVLSESSDSPSKFKAGIFEQNYQFAEAMTRYSKISVHGQEYAHTVLNSFPGQVPGNTAARVHVFLPRQSERIIWWESSKSPLLIASLILPIGLVVSLALANQVTRPLARLKNQVQHIANGNLSQVEPESRNDEITDLQNSINEMAKKMQDQEHQLRLNERLRTLIQFGNGIAHHLRNAATGCKMAIQLLAADNPIGDSENYKVASRQIDLMNNYIKKFLVISKSTEGHEPPVEKIDLNATLENVMFLLQPSAKHLNVEIEVGDELQNANVNMTSDDAEQLMINLISNAIAASSEMVTRDTGKRARVLISLRENENREIEFIVADNGCGPPEEIADDLFRPFVSGSREGTGLGLSLVKDIADRVHGDVEWQRIDSETVFRFVFGNRVTG